MNLRALAACRLLAILLACIGLTGCNFAGPLSIDEGRIRYNNVIEATTQTQLLLNLVRASQNRAPLFIDVTEVDAAMTFSGSLSTLLSGLGIGKKSGPFRTGSLTSGAVSGGVAYAESPTVRYIPLQGQALIQQLAASIAIDALPQLYDADVPLPTLLDFTVDRLTPGFNDYGAALNAIGELDYLDALTIAAAAAHGDESNAGAMVRSDEKKQTIYVQTAAPPAARHTALVLYLQPISLPCDDTLLAARLWAELLQLYTTVRSDAENRELANLENLLNSIAGCQGESLASQTPGRAVSKQALLDALQKVPSIELRTEPLKASGDPASGTHVSNTAPFLRMRSAYAIFRSIEVSDYSPTELVDLISPAGEAAITGMPWDDGQQFHLFTYQQYCAAGNEVDPRKCKELREMYAAVPASVQLDMDHHICAHGRHIIGLAERNQADQRIQEAARRWMQICGQFSFRADGISDPALAPFPLLTINEDETSGPVILTPERRMEERLLRKQRRFILIVKSLTPPADSFASVDVDGYYYYIARDDRISQRNFRLLQLISTMQAVAPAAPLTLTVSVGGH